MSTLNVPPLHGRGWGLLLCTWPKGGKLKLPFDTVTKCGLELNIKWLLILCLKEKWKKGLK